MTDFFTLVLQFSLGFVQKAVTLTFCGSGTKRGSVAKNKSRAQDAFSLVCDQNRR
jgi:hypothetical protein